MSIARLISRGQSGLAAYEVTVEVHIGGGLPTFRIVGLPAAAVRESKDRVRAALQTCGVAVPASRITAHLGPADIPKDGGRFDLPLALGVMLAELGCDWDTTRTEFIGELSLSGELRPVRGALPAVIAAREAGRAMVLPAANADEAGLVEGAEVYLAAHLLEVIAHLNRSASLPGPPRFPAAVETPIRHELAEVRGQPVAKRALTVAAAGAHHLLMVGPPGSGKSMLAARLPDLLPPLAATERLAVACIASVAGEKVAARVETHRPFRAPHHSASSASLVGGGSRPRPGEISLAHLGVLFLDELPEFSRSALEALREPLEQGTVRITRVNEAVTFPARFQLLAAMNPCPCGYAGDGSERCRCTGAQLQRYRARVSGPLIDRFDLHVALKRVSLAAHWQPGEALESARVRKEVARARARQLERGPLLNADLADADVWGCAAQTPAARSLLGKASERWKLSARGSIRVVKVARTIADLAGSARVEAEHLAEALQLRCLDRPFEYR